MKGWIIFFAIVLFFVLLSFIKIGVVIGYKKDFSLAIKMLFSPFIFRGCIFLCVFTAKRIIGKMYTR